MESIDGGARALAVELLELRDALAVLVNDEFSSGDTDDLPQWGGEFERGAMWAFAEAARLLSATLTHEAVSDRG